MEIDLNDSNQLTLDNVAKLIGSVDDSEHRQLRVSLSGIAYISDVVGAEDIDNLAFRFETWGAGNGYVGARAADDSKWVAMVFRDLSQNWPEPKSTYIDGLE